MLFTTKTCPNCKMAKTLLTKAKIPYTVIDAMEDTDVTNSLDVKQVPTLIVKKGKKQEKIVNLSNIKKYIEQVS